MAGLVMQQLGRLPRRGEAVHDRRVRVPRDARRPAPHRQPEGGPATRRACRPRSARSPTDRALRTARCPGRSRAGAARRRPADAGVRAGRLLAARLALPGACWSGCGSARRRASGAALGFAFGFGTFAAGTCWLYISIHVFGQAPLLGGAAADAGAGLDHGRLPRAARLGGGALAAAPRRAALAGRRCRRLGAGGMVARLVPLGLFLAVARLFADRHLARGSRAASAAAPAVARCCCSAPAPGRRCCSGRVAPRARAAAGRAAAALAARAALRGASTGRGRRRAGGGRDPAGRDPTGHEMARFQP